MPSLLNGFAIVVDENALSKKWVFPKDRFVEYGPEDEWWARKVGFGHEVTEPACYQVGNRLVIHPTLYERVKAEAEKRAKDYSRFFELGSKGPYHRYL